MPPGCACASLNPGVTRLPPRSIRRVEGPASASMSALVPIANTRPPVSANASTSRSRVPIVNILPLCRIVSGRAVPFPNAAALALSPTAMKVRRFNGLGMVSSIVHVALLNCVVTAVDRTKRPVKTLSRLLYVSCLNVDSIGVQIEPFRGWRLGRYYSGQESGSGVGRCQILPESPGNGPRKHMMLTEPGGIRLEFI